MAEEIPEAPCADIELVTPQEPAPLTILPYPSANHNARAHGVVDTIVLHYTAIASLDVSLRVLTDVRPVHRVSAHYVVGVDGSVFRLVAEDRRAWHAGEGSWRGLEDVNDRSIGIEIVNAGFARDGSRPPYSEAQIEAVLALCQEIQSRHAIRWVIGHSDLAPTRKLDPGEHFPWRRLAEQGVGFWTEDFAPPYATPRQMLIDLGYDTTDLPLALRAFERHWYPEALTAGATNTLGRLSAVARALT
ncbi:MAG: N-acetylmuramoyl-L-alanine amidase [Kiritimatiellia bacterium]